MIDPPQLARVPAQRTAVIRMTIPRNQIQQVMGPAFSELMAAVNAQGIAMTGAWFSHHFRVDPATFDFEVGVPVASPVAPVGRVMPGELPAARVARTVYHGGYEGLGGGWGEFEEWIAAEELSTAPGFWERYVVGPESGPDASAWRTELVRPLTG